MKNLGLVYLAVPYTLCGSASVLERERNVRLAAFAAGWLLKQDYNVYCPVIHWHPVAKVCNLKVEWNFWKDLDLEMMNFCEELHILCLSGWNRSVGINTEFDFAIQESMPVRYIVCETHSPFEHLIPDLHTAAEFHFVETPP